MKIGLRTVDDALFNIGTYKRVNRNYGDKAFVLNAINTHDYESLRNISEFFYEGSGIYYRLCRYMAFLYRYDWYVTPYTISLDKEVKEPKLRGDFAKVLNYLDNSQIKRLSGDIALTIMKDGAFYGFVMDFGDSFGIQKLPARYCRTRFYRGMDPIVELNLQFFDSYFVNPQQRMQVLKMFPEDVQKAYRLYKQNKLTGDYPGSTTVWYPLEPGIGVKISLNDGDFPPLIGTIPSIIDLDLAQELDRKKTMQQLLKIVIQKLPLDKNGDLIFDVDEAKDIHNNAVAMLKRAVGIDVLTTFADIDVADMRDNNTTTTRDDLEKVERTVFNNSGVAQNLFNADGNIAIQNSILNDESSIRDMILQMQAMYESIIRRKFDRKGHYTFRFSILETTQYNYKDLSKMYKEQESLGHSKMLSQVALGQQQSVILATITFENDVLHLAESMIPPLSSNTISKNGIIGTSGAGAGGSQGAKSNTDGEEKKTGRPEKEDAEKSDKTIANRESMS